MEKKYTKNDEKPNVANESSAVYSRIQSRRNPLGDNANPLSPQMEEKINKALQQAKAGQVKRINEKQELIDYLDGL